MPANKQTDSNANTAKPTGLAKDELRSIVREMWRALKQGELTKVASMLTSGS